MAAKADPLRLHGIHRLDDDKLRAAGRAAKKRMWKTPILTKKRRDYEKLANEYFRAANQAKRVNRSKLGRNVPEKMWSLPVKKRKVNFAGFFSSTLGIPSDAILAIAAGAKVGPGLLEGEWRKSILGGLLALETVGLIAAGTTKSLKAPTIGSAKINEALAKAAGHSGKKIKDVYAIVVKRIAKYGPGMRTLAWSFRMILWIKDIAGIEAVHATAAGVVQLFPGVGTVVGMGIAAHSAITLALASSLSLKAEAAIEKATPIAQREADRAHAATAAGLPVPDASGPVWPLPFSPMALGVGLAAAFGLGLVVYVSDQ